MKINIATSSLASLPLLTRLAKKEQLSKIFIPKGLSVFENHLKTFFSHIEIQTCNKNFAQDGDFLFGADLLLIFGFPFRIKPIPDKAFNIHFGELPENRGPEPLFWTLKQNKKIAYVTIHEVTEALDAGPIYSQKGYPIMPGETLGLLNSRLANLIVPQVEAFILEKGKPQVQEEANAQYQRRPNNMDLMIDWVHMRSKEIENLVLACNPNFIGARTTFNKIPFQIVEAFVPPQFNLTEEQKTKKPGDVIIANEHGLAVLTSDFKALFITVGHMNEGTFSAIKLINMGIDESIRFI